MFMQSLLFQKHIFLYVQTTQALSTVCTTQIPLVNEYCSIPWGCKQLREDGMESIVRFIDMIT